MSVKKVVIPIENITRSQSIKPYDPPKGKHTYTLHFDTQVGVENFAAWYSGQGEQQANYYGQAYGEDWVHVKPPADACPECEYADDGIQSKFWENRKLRTYTHKCGNCSHRYKVDNPYHPDGL